MRVAGLCVTSLPWRSELAELKGRLACVFQRSETREQVGLYLDGLVGGVERKNGWQLAEHAGDEVPWRMQAVLGRGCWEADCARDICRDYVIERLGDPAGVLILDETGFVKKGTQSVGVARQYSGTAGRIENCQHPDSLFGFNVTCQFGLFLGQQLEHNRALGWIGFYFQQIFITGNVLALDEVLHGYPAVQSNTS